MPISWRKPKLKFQAKVLLPIVAVMALFLSGTMWLVHNRIDEQLQIETSALLANSQTLFTNALSTYSESLISQLRPIPNSPFNSIAAKFQTSSDDKESAAETMRLMLRDILENQTKESAVILFEDGSGKVLADASRNATTDRAAFQHASSPFIKSVAAAREPEVHLVLAGDNLFNAVFIPCIQSPSGELRGILVFGVPLDSAVAQKVISPDTEVVFVANHKTVASAFEKLQLNETLVREFGELSSRGRTNSLILEGEHYRVRTGTFSIPRGQGDAGYVLLVSYEKALRALRDEERYLLLCSLLGVVLSAGIVWALVRRVTQPLRELRDSAEAVGRGDFTKRIEIHSADELGELAGVFNHMTENLQKSTSQLEKTVEILRTTQAQLMHSEKLSAVGEFVAGVAHELNNPLTALIGYSELLQSSAVDEDSRSSLNRISNSANRCHKIVQSLLSFARQHPPERKLTNVNGLVDSVVEILMYELRTSNIKVTKELSPNLPRLLVDPHQIQQVFLNIVNNARQAIEAYRANGSMRISTGASGQRVWVRFEDDGPGISEENLAKIFNPFFTTKPVGKGTGLGLSLSYGIIQEHGGTIVAQSKIGQGTTFIIEFPITADAEARSLADASQTPAPLPLGNGKSVLIVDDEEDILDMITKTLKKQGYQIHTASEGAGALELIAKQNYDLILSDWKMPGINGQQLYQQLKSTHPEATRRMIFMTGDVLSEKTEKFLQENNKLCLTKPFSLVEFQHLIGKFLEEHH